MYHPLRRFLQEPMGSWFLSSSSCLGGPTSKIARVLRGCVFQSSRIRWLHGCPSRWQQGVKVAVSEDRRKLNLQCEGEQERRFHGVWLRHNCRCPVCHSNETNMSRVNPNQLEGVEISSARVEGREVHVDWMSQDGSTHKGYFPVAWLKENDYSLQDSFWRRQREAEPLVASTLPRIEFEEILSSDEGLFSWLKQLNHYGLSLVEGVPSTQAIRKLINKFSHIQATIYGEMFNVITVEDPAIPDLGYSSDELLYHQDLLFYESPPGLECFHCIRFDECVEGGESILLDTYPVVEEMRRKHPKQFDTLTRVPVTFQRVLHKGEVPSDLKVGRHHIVLDRHGKVAAINWNPHHLDPLFVPEDQVEGYYEAFVTLSKMFTNSPLKMIHRLVPGEALFFNNRRIMHARNAFKLNGGVRHFQGFYINIDYLRSEFQVLSRRLSKGEESKCVFSHSV